MNAALSMRFAGMSLVVTSSLILAAPRTASGHEGGCPIEGCQIAPPPTIAWPGGPGGPGASGQIGEPPLVVPPMPGAEPKKEGPKIEPVPAEGGAKLTLKMEGPKDRYANMPVKYFLAVTNSGKSAATNLLIRAFLPEKSEFVSASEPGVHVESQVAWVLKDLEAGGKVT